MLGNWRPLIKYSGVATTFRVFESWRSLSTEISTGTLSRGSTPYPSYRGVVTWGSLDKDTITASARPAKGRKLDGTIVDGYVFEVSRKGTAPATGEPAVKRIFAKLQKDAELTGTGAAFGEFTE